MVQRETHHHRRQYEQQESQHGCGGNGKKQRVEQSEVRHDKRATSAPPQYLRKLSVAGCEGIRGSGIIAVLRSGRLGRHSSALAADGVDGLNDGHVEELVVRLSRLRVSETEQFYSLSDDVANDVESAKDPAVNGGLLADR